MCARCVAARVFAPQASASIEEDAAAAAAARSGWAGWAAAGLSSLLGGRGSAGAAVSNGDGRRSSTGAAANGTLSRGGSGISSPLAHHVHQRELVHQAHWQQHEAAHAQHIQDHQHSMQGAHAAHSHQLPCSTLQEKQSLPAAVRSFQQHKIMRADVFGGTSRRSSQDAPTEGLDGHSSGQQVWSPRWLLQSFAPFGSPVSPSTLSTAADSPPTSSWGLLNTCRVSEWGADAVRVSYLLLVGAISVV